MGSAESLLEQTDWEVADGGLLEPSQTIDGLPPNPGYQVISLEKRDRFVNRLYKIFDKDAKLLYECKDVPGTMAWFEILDSQGEKLFQVQTGQGRIDWTVLTYAPNYPGQETDESASKRGKKALYRKALLKKKILTGYGDVFLYKKSESDPLGAIDKTVPILRVEDCDTSLKARNQSFLPLPQEEDDDIDVKQDDNKTLSEEETKKVHPPLVGYWDWEKKKGNHKMNMHLAKGTDIALHVALAIAIDILRIENNVLDKASYLI